MRRGQCVVCTAALGCGGVKIVQQRWSWPASRRLACFVLLCSVLRVPVGAAPCCRWALLSAPQRDTPHTDLALGWNFLLLSACAWRLGTHVVMQGGGACAHARSNPGAARCSVAAFCVAAFLCEASCWPAVATLLQANDRRTAYSADDGSPGLGATRSARSLRANHSLSHPGQ